jgi:hypothetical protein
MFFAAIKPQKSLLIASFLVWLTAGCTYQKTTQCQEIIAIANEASHQAKQITYNSKEKVVAMKNWLQAANIMTMAAKQIEALPIKDPQLINYQGNLASIFRIYSQATYDAVQAREKKNLSALKMAHDSAQEAGKLNQVLVTKINDYCTVK